MNIVVCGAGEVGSHAAEELAAAGHRITVVDTNADRLRYIGERLDIATCRGNAADAEILQHAGCADANWLLATTDSDEINLLTASIAKGIGAEHSLARVHHRAYFEQRGLEYTRHLGVDELICPEYSTAHAIARKLRNPGAMAIEDFARGAIEIQQFTVSKSAPAIGESLIDIALPAGSRLAAVTRKGGTFVPDGTTVIDRGDTIVLVGNSDAFHTARSIFKDEASGRRRIALMGAGPMSVWLCRALRDRNMAIRLFEPERRRAEELADKLDWVTVINADPTDKSVFDEERLYDADTFVALMDSDDANIIAGIFAKLKGVAQVLTVVQQSKYTDVMFDVGIDDNFSPRAVAAEEIGQLIDESPLRRISSLMENVIDVYRVRVGEKSKVIGRPLHEIKLTPDWTLVAIQRGEQTFVPQASESIRGDDLILVVGRSGNETKLKRLFSV
ncbi:MAG: Trk system potassium transporter TrkA [Planctomycetota bacterium]|jgi:trk system potassium uptake protein TrkA